MGMRFQPMSLASAETDPHTDEELNANIRAVASELRRILKVEISQVAMAIGASEPTAYAKLNGNRRFTAAELRRLALFYGVGMETFFRPAGELQAEVAEAVRTGSNSPLLMLLDPPLQPELPLEDPAERRQLTLVGADGVEIL